MKKISLTKRCLYCRPQWTYGIQNKVLRRMVAFIWPPHFYGGDGINYRPPYSDGMCPAAAAFQKALETRADLAVWRARWARWGAYADEQAPSHDFKALGFPAIARLVWVLDYQAARRRDMEVTENACI